MADFSRISRKALAVAVISTLSQGAYAAQGSFANSMEVEDISIKQNST